MNNSRLVTKLHAKSIRVVITMTFWTITVISAVLAREEHNRHSMSVYVGGISSSAASVALYGCHR